MLKKLNPKKVGFYFKDILPLKKNETFYDALKKMGDFTGFKIEKKRDGETRDFIITATSDSLGWSFSFYALRFKGGEYLFYNMSKKRKYSIGDIFEIMQDKKRYLSEVEHRKKYLKFGKPTCLFCNKTDDCLKEWNHICEEFESVIFECDDTDEQFNEALRLNLSVGSCKDCNKRHKGLCIDHNIKTEDNQGCCCFSGKSKFKNTIVEKTIKNKKDDNDDYDLDNKEEEEEDFKETKGSCSCSKSACEKCRETNDQWKHGGCSDCEHGGEDEDEDEDDNIKYKDSEENIIRRSDLGKIMEEISKELAKGMSRKSSDSCGREDQEQSFVCPACGEKHRAVPQGGGFFIVICRSGRNRTYSPGSPFTCLTCGHRIC